MLVSTPLALSIKKAYPESTVDYLVFAGTESILENNPHVDGVHTIKPGEKGLQTLLALWRRYDIAISCNPSDRTVLFTAATAKRSIGFSYFARKEWWKSLILSECRKCDDRVHIVPLILRQLESLGIPPQRRVVMGFDPAARPEGLRLPGALPYVVLHPYTRRQCKEWPAAGWAELALLLEEYGLRPLFTRSPAACDKRVTDALVRQGVRETCFLSEPLSMPKLAAVISGARAYVGVDTAVTHMAAALDVPTIALYGPTLSRHWGPWPNEWPDDTPYAPSGGVQRRGNVTLIQQGWQCVPCNREECSISDRNVMECLDQLKATDVYAELTKVV